MGVQPLRAPDGGPVSGSVGGMDRAAGVVRGRLAAGDVRVLGRPPHALLTWSLMVSSASQGWGLLACIALVPSGSGGSEGGFLGAAPPPPTGGG